MSQDERNLLDVLKFELAYLEHGGYRKNAAPWRSPLIFGSPTCLSFDGKTAPRSCDACFLSQLAPREFRFNRAPCRHISLNGNGDTVDSLYRSGAHQDLETAVRSWLQATIKQIEAFANLSVNDQPEKGRTVRTSTASIHDQASAEGD
jgi:hypothetical protein